MELPLVCLGYASIPLRKGKPTLRVHFKQSISKHDYIQHLYSVFYPFVGTPPRGRSPRGAGPARVYQSIYFQTFRHNVVPTGPIDLKFYNSLFYLDYKHNGLRRKKRVAKNIH